jgi:hypothetical protein
VSPFTRAQQRQGGRVGGLRRQLLPDARAHVRNMAAAARQKFVDAIDPSITDPTERARLGDLAYRAALRQRAYKAQRSAQRRGRVAQLEGIQAETGIA